jgi:hypothetical protein
MCMVRLIAGGEFAAHSQMTQAERDELPYRMQDPGVPFGEDGMSSVHLGRKLRPLRKPDKKPYLVTLTGRRQKAVPLEAVYLAIARGVIPGAAVLECLGLPSEPSDH